MCAVCSTHRHHIYIAFINKIQWNVLAVSDILKLKQKNEVAINQPNVYNPFILICFHKYKCRGYDDMKSWQ